VSLNPFRKARPSRSKEPAALEIVRQFQSETDAIREAPEPRWARVTVFVLGGLILSVVGLTFLTEMDRVVASVSGQIVLADQREIVFQALDSLTIKSIDALEGQEVVKDQLLATLDPTFASADVMELELKIASLEPQILRDMAELEEGPLVFPEWTEPDRLRYAALQKAYYDQHTAQYKAQLNSFDAKMLATKASMEKYRADEAHYDNRKALTKKIEEMRTILAQHGSDSRLNMYLSQDQNIEMLRNLDMDHNSYIEAEHTLATEKADREAFIQNWKAQLSLDLVTSRNSLDAAKSELEKAKRHQELVKLTAAEPSVVLTVAKLSVGSVLKAGDMLFKLMPLNAPIEAEAHVVSRDIGFPRPGDKCVLKISAFNYMEHGTAEGTVRWVSENAWTIDDNGQPTEAYYKVRCTVDAMHFVGVPEKFRLVPGMTLEADMTVGTRSVAMYLLSGILRGFDESMREP
jgi:hemolysin D